MSYYTDAKEVYERNAGKTISTEKYIGVVSGFHFKWDDGDSPSLIVAITKEKTPNKTGMTYRLNGDSHVTHKGNPLGYDFIHFADIKNHKPLLP